MNVISTVVIAAALSVACDVSLAAEPAVIKTIRPQALPSQPMMAAMPAEAIEPQVLLVAEGLPMLRQQGRDALKQIQQEALNQHWLQFVEAPALAASVAEERLADADNRQVAVK